MPGLVSITSAPPTAANLARRLRTWLSIVRSVMAKPGPWTRSMIASRVKTRRGASARGRTMLNSVTVSGTSILHIVARPQLHAQDAVDLIVARRQEQDRQIALGADPATGLDPVHAGHVDVQHDEVRPAQGDVGQSGLAVGGLPRRQTRLLEREGQQVADVRGVVDHQNGALHDGHVQPSVREVNGTGGGAATGAG